MQVLQLLKVNYKGQRPMSSLLHALVFLAAIGSATAKYKDLQNPLGTLEANAKKLLIAISAQRGRVTSDDVRTM